ncbi:hypothetical protein WAF17_20275 [Bernardetia sp. ABR2-2B]|uniref:hypothetical protein n=1 Tax=Bernardetia sp. ABR2-2B TaxID=3127472 RepID=UPI0030D1ACC1
MKLEDIPKKQPFQIPDEAHFDTISSKIYAQLEEEEKENQDSKSISIHSKKEKNNKFWVKPQVMGIAATLLLLFIAIAGIYTFSSKSDINSQTNVALDNKTQEVDFSKIPTEQINDFLLNEDISENELMSFIPQGSTLETNNVFEESDLNSIDTESLDLMLEEEYL